MIELGQQTLCHGSAVLQATLVHVATNSIDFFWPSGGIGSGDVHLQRLRCDQCATSLSLDHLIDCPEPYSVQFRNRLADDIRTTLGVDPCTQRWLATRTRCSLVNLLLTLFPIIPTASASERLRHLTCAMAGAFTRRQSNSASKLIGFLSAEDGGPTFLRLRLQCLESIGQAYRNWKVAAAGQ